MASLNKVMLIGNLGADPEVRYLPSGAPTCTVSLATSHSSKDKESGERREYTEWHRVVFFNGLAEVVRDYLKKGSSIYVEGRLQTRKFTDGAGIERYSTEVVAKEMKMMGGRKPEGVNAGAGGGPMHPDDMDDDVPY